MRKSPFRNLMPHVIPFNMSHQHAICLCMTNKMKEQTKPTKYISLYTWFIVHILCGWKIIYRFLFLLDMMCVPLDLAQGSFECAIEMKMLPYGLLVWLMLSLMLFIWYSQAIVKVISMRQMSNEQISRYLNSHLSYAIKY